MVPCMTECESRFVFVRGGILIVVAWTNQLMGFELRRTESGNVQQVQPLWARSRRAEQHEMGPLTVVRKACDAVHVQAGNAKYW